MSRLLQTCSSERAAACRKQSLSACISSSRPMLAKPRLVVRRPLDVKAQASLSQVKTKAPKTAPGSTADVYINEPKPLREGEQKRVISVFVADEAGLINRVTGVFARRGANIESLAVGLTHQKALFTIVFTGTKYTVDNLVKQLSKLVNVRLVEDVTNAKRLEREMMLIKVNAPPGPSRTEVLELVQIFRAKVNDVSDGCVTICASGDPGKILALQKVMSKFGVIEITRTGRVALKRGDFYSEANSVEDIVMPRSLRGVMPPSEYLTRELSTESDFSSSDADEESSKLSAQPKELGVYTSQDSQDFHPGVWTIKDILKEDEGRTLRSLDGIPIVGATAHTLNIEVIDAPGVLNQVTGVFSRRGYNIQSLAVGPSERAGMSRICLVCPGTQETIGKLLRQLSKLVVVQSITDLTDIPFVNRELILVKVRCPPKRRGELRDLCDIFRADIVDVSPSFAIVEILGKGDKMKALTLLLEEFGIVEIARTGRVAIIRESGVDTKFLENMAAQHVW